MLVASESPGQQTYDKVVCLPSILLRLKIDIKWLSYDTSQKWAQLIPKLNVLCNDGF